MMVDLTSPPRAFKSASEGTSATRREARLKSRTSCLKLSDKGAFLHVERMGFDGYDATVERFQGFDAADKPSALMGRNPSPSSPRVKTLLGACAPGGGEEKLRPLSRQSSLNGIVWGPLGESLGESSRPLETPPTAPGAFEALGSLETTVVATPPSHSGRASDIQSLCRAPQQSRERVVSSRSSNWRSASSCTANASTRGTSNATSTASSAATAPNPAPFPRRPVWGELAHVPAWGDVLATSPGAQAQLQGVAQEMRGGFARGGGASTSQGMGMGQAMHTGVHDRGGFFPIGSTDINRDSSSGSGTGSGTGSGSGSGSGSGGGGDGGSGGGGGGGDGGGGGSSHSASGSRASRTLSDDSASSYPELCAAMATGRPGPVSVSLSVSHRSLSQDASASQDTTASGSREHSGSISQDLDGARMASRDEISSEINPGSISQDLPFMRDVSASQDLGPGSLSGQDLFSSISGSICGHLGPGAAGMSAAAFVRPTCADMSIGR